VFAPADLSERFLASLIDFPAQGFCPYIYVRTKGAVRTVEKDARLEVRLPSEELEATRAAAAAEGVSVSVFVRDALAARGVCEGGAQRPKSRQPEKLKIAPTPDTLKERMPESHARVMAGLPPEPRPFRCARCPDDAGASMPTRCPRCNTRRRPA
jgi:hypothetical protein